MLWRIKSVTTDSSALEKVFPRKLFENHTIFSSVVSRSLSKLNHLRHCVIFRVPFKHIENEITFAIKFLIYSSRGKGNCLFFHFPRIAWKVPAYLPQLDRNVVDDVSVVGAFERLVEHIESFVVKLMPVRRQTDRGLISSAPVVRDRSMDCSDYSQVRQWCKRLEPK